MKIDLYLRFHTVFGQSLLVSGNMLSPTGDGNIAAQPMQYLNSEFWHFSFEADATALPVLQYHYLFSNEHGEVVREGEQQRQFHLEKSGTEHLLFIDTWNAPGALENAFYTAPFQDIFLQSPASPKVKKTKTWTHLFRVKAPLLGPGEAVCLLGSGAALHDWDQANPVLMEPAGEWFIAKLDLSETPFPFVYKYGIYQTKQKAFIRFEEGDNRFVAMTSPAGSHTVLQDDFVRLGQPGWKGAGIAIPVFSLRSNDSFGVGEFNDLKLLGDWAYKAGLKIIQLLPVNDTSATFTARDSYPYAAISAFALHPIYINLETVAGKKYVHALKTLGKKQKQLNALPEVDYETVMRFKMRLLRELYDMQGEEYLKDSGFKSFFNDNAHWLTPYAVFSYYRDKNGTADFSTWKTGAVYDATEVFRMAAAKSKTAREIQFYFFIQYHLHLQLQDAVKYIHKKGIAVKGDIPIGIFRNSVDAWQQPELYHMNWQAGAPPDDFAVKGQNWGFPTYNWKRMQEDGFKWWQQRFAQMSHYFDAFRIDHILGFFRIWSIPLHAVEGILGRFIPALPVTVHEFGERGIWFDHDRFCKPYITDAVLDQLFGDDAGFVKEHFLVPGGAQYELKPGYTTQVAISRYFEEGERGSATDPVKQGLFDLVSNVLLFEEEGSGQTAYHFRISMESTTSFQHLDAGMQHRLKELYVDYFYHRQDAFWKEEALRKLPALKASTNMLICGEDLGMVPHCVPDVMSNLGILSLEIQRMPKNPATEFFHPRTAPYLSVITPSTHDMSTIRGWWEEDRTRTQTFYNTILETAGEAPYFCEPWINRAIILQHLYAPAMWSIFQLQDLLGMSNLLRRGNPHEERINQPADPKHYWRYRMHLTLEDLLKEHGFIAELRDYIRNSGRL